MSDMNRNTERQERDPLGLSRLPLLEPGTDGWPAIRAALEADREQRRVRWRRVGGLALAASVLLALGLSFRGSEMLLPGVQEQASVQPPAGGEATGALPEAGTLPELIAMSQLLEHHIGDLRENTSGLPARSALYTAELADLIARVDGEISLDPESVDLWAQRVNLLLDLQYIYQHQFDREYGRMASL